MSGSIEDVNNRTGMMLSMRTIAGAATPAAMSDKNPRLVFINPITAPRRFFDWVRFGWRQPFD